MLRLDSYDERLRLALQRKLTRSRERLEYLINTTNRFSLMNLILLRREAVLGLRDRACLSVKNYIDRAKDKLMVNAGKADALSPLAILSRGYSIARRGDSIVSRIGDASVGDEISIVLSDGSILAEVKDISKEN